ncbi:hypothetical protein Bbelb_320150 [Branchiostoma belcheri]|nr:hypothetical protein Bbelb_320150 [Branchiostoma belcheri]
MTNTNVKATCGGLGMRYPCFYRGGDRCSNSQFYTTDCVGFDTVSTNCATFNVIAYEVCPGVVNSYNCPALDDVFLYRRNWTSGDGAYGLDHQTTSYVSGAGQFNMWALCTGKVLTTRLPVTCLERAGSTCGPSVQTTSYVSAGAGQFNMWALCTGKVLTTRLPVTCLERASSTCGPSVQTTSYVSGAGRFNMWALCTGKVLTTGLPVTCLGRASSTCGPSVQDELHRGTTSAFGRCTVGGGHQRADVDECSNSPCLGGGTCVDQIGGYTCDCPKGTAGDRCEAVVNGGSCYKFSPAAASHFAAEKACHAEGGHLAVVKDPGKQRFLSNHIPAGNSDSHWIGTKVTSDKLVFSDQPSVFDQVAGLDWAEDSPGMPCALCVLLDNADGHKAKTTSCMEQHSYICQSVQGPAWSNTATSVNPVSTTSCMEQHSYICQSGNYNLLYGATQLHLSVRNTATSANPVSTTSCMEQHSYICKSGKYGATKLHLSIRNTATTVNPVTTTSCMEQHSYICQPGKYNILYGATQLHLSIRYICQSGKYNLLSEAPQLHISVNPVSTNFCMEQHSYICQFDKYNFLYGATQPNVCLHGGNCSSCFGGTDTVCACRSGFDGKFCENHVAIQWCSVASCPPGWTCDDQLTHFLCIDTADNGLPTFSQPWAPDHGLPTSSRPWPPDLLPTMASRPPPDHGFPIFSRPWPPDLLPTMVFRSSPDHGLPTSSRPWSSDLLPTMASRPPPDHRLPICSRPWSPDLLPNMASLPSQDHDNEARHKNRLSLSVQQRLLSKRHVLQGGGTGIFLLLVPLGAGNNRQTTTENKLTPVQPPDDCAVKMYEEAEPVRTPQAGSDRKQPSHDPPGRLGNTNGHMHVHRGNQACHENKGGQGTSSNVYEEAEVVKLENISGDVPYGTDTSTDTDTTQHVGARVYCMVAALAVVVALAITGPILLMFIKGRYNSEERLNG